MGNAKKLIGATVMLLVSLFAVVTSTFAWLTVQNTPEIGNINFSVTDGDAVYFSLDGTTWRNNMSGNDLYDFLGLYTIDANNEKTYRLNYKDVTPTPTANGFIATFNALEGTLNSDYRGSVYSYRDLTDPVPTAKAESSIIYEQNINNSIAAEKIYTSDAGYVAFTLHLRAVNDCYLYLYGASAKPNTATNAADVAAAKMVRIGLALNSEKTSVMRVFNPTTYAANNDVTVANTKRTMSDMFGGDFYAKEIINLLFSDLMNKDEVADNFLVPNPRTQTIPTDASSFTHYMFNPNHATVSLIEQAVQGSYNINRINGTFTRATGGASRNEISSTKEQVGEPIVYLPTYDGTDGTIVDLTVYLWLEGWSNAATDAARRGQFTLDFKFIGLEDTLVKEYNLVD